METSRIDAVRGFFYKGDKPRKPRIASVTLLGAAALVGVTVPPAAGFFERAEQGQEDRVAEQVEGRIRGFASVEKILHEQILISGDKDVAVISLKDGDTCTVVLRAPGREVATEVGDFGDCPIKPAQAGMTSAKN